jgi:hypothetical protein
VEHDLVRPGRRPGADGVRDRVRVAGDGGGALAVHGGQPPRRVRAGHRHQVEDDGVRARPAGGSLGLCDGLAGAAQLVRGGGRVEDGAVGELAAQPEAPRPSGRAEQRRGRQRRPVEGHVAELHVAAVDRQPLAVEQPAQRLQVLGEQGQR